MSRAASGLAGLVLALAAPLSVAGQPAPEIAPEAAVTVRLEPPAAPATLGTPFEIVAHVELRGGARGPWMLAPTSDGPALDVVRGRLLSIDAEVTPGAVGVMEATLRIPVLPRAAGTTVLRARVSAYACEERRCRAITGEASLVVEVLAP